MTPEERQRKIESLDRLAYWLDERFEIPGIGIRFGLDGLLGLVPGVGDTATSLVSLYLVAEARRAGASRWTMMRMLTNVGIDWLVGLIPLVGDIFDIGFKANRRNIAILKQHLDPTP
ncbi:MAG: DUF4112 domain-containing protein [Alphaproteobacteria bacterium]|nr:DUF4112 domain-containing protein [Alphaproteobacteria bacterium]